MEPKLLNSEELKGGCPPGKSILWVCRERDRGAWLPPIEEPISGYLQYESAEDAVADMGLKLAEFKGCRVVVNAKAADGNSLHVWNMSHRVLPRVRSVPPAAEAKTFSFLSPSTWF